jgi:hypothetical protein
MAERRIAINAVVSGAVVAAFGAVVWLAAWLWGLLKFGMAYAHSTSNLTLAGVFILLAVGTWKRILAVPIIAVVLAGAGAVWFVSRGDVGSALRFIAVAVCFLLAAWGIRVLRATRNDGAPAS